MGLFSFHSIFNRQEKSKRNISQLFIGQRKSRRGNFLEALKLKGPKEVLLRVETIINEYLKSRNILKNNILKGSKIHVCFSFYS